MLRYTAGAFALTFALGCASGDLATPNAGIPRAPGPPAGNPPPQSDPNRAPVAVPDTLRVAAGGTLVVAPPGLLLNDSDADGDPLAAYPDGATWVRPFEGIAPEERRLDLTGGTVHGWDTFGGFEYTPFPNFTGIDKLLYRAHEDVENGLASSPVEVVIVVE